MPQTVPSLLAALAVLFVSFPNDTAAQSMSADDERELQSYRLTMPKLKQLTQVYASLARVMRQDPKLQRMGTLRAEYEALERKDELSEADERRIEALSLEIERLDEAIDLEGPAGALSQGRTIGEMAQAIDAHPQLSSAVKSAGLSSREFATLQLALMQASFAQGFMKAGTLETLPNSVNPENVRFLQEHEAEIRALSKEWELLGLGGEP